MSSNFNKIYHKGKFRNREYGKHLRPYQKRLGNKRFRKFDLILEEDEFTNRLKKRTIKSKNCIKVKITVKSGNFKYSYLKRFRGLKQFNDSIKRPNVIRYQILNNLDLDYK